MANPKNWDSVSKIARPGSGVSYDWEGEDALRDWFNWGNAGSTSDFEESLRDIEDAINKRIYESYDEFTYVKKDKAPFSKKNVDILKAAKKSAERIKKKNWNKKANIDNKCWGCIHSNTKNECIFSPKPKFVGDNCISREEINLQSVNNCNKKGLTMMQIFKPP